MTVLTSVDVNSKTSAFVRIMCSLTGKCVFVCVCVVYLRGVSDTAPTDDLGHDGGSGTFLPPGVSAETRGSEAEVFSSDCLRLCVPVVEEALDLMYLSVGSLVLHKSKWLTLAVAA